MPGEKITHPTSTQYNKTDSHNKSYPIHPCVYVVVNGFGCRANHNIYETT